MFRDSTSQLTVFNVWIIEAYLIDYSINDQDRFWINAEYSEYLDK